MSEYKPAKLFTVEEANAMLPLVRAITGDIVRLASDLLERRQRIDHLTIGRDPEERDPYSDEVAEVQRELEKDEQRLHEYADELLALGVELKSAPTGLVDFPCIMDGRIVYLCWQFDEPELLYWHELDAGFTGRQPLIAGTVADGQSGDSNDLSR